MTSVWINNFIYGNAFYFRVFVRKLLIKVQLFRRSYLNLCYSYLLILNVLAMQWNLNRNLVRIINTIILFILSHRKKIHK